MRLGAEMYRAEYGVAVAGAVMGIHPFNQPNVEAAKDFAREAMAERDPVDPTGDLEVLDFATARRRFSKLVEEAEPEDYVALQAFLPPSTRLDAALRALRIRLAERNVTSTAGVGPRYLHSTGQLHKGGPNEGIFLQIVDNDRPGVPVPETEFSFDAVIDAQALGDAQALADRDRRLVRVSVEDAAEIGSLLA